ncbi:hypothetical protein GCM10010441_55930 [Kitasatospora paracochleata]|uniref:Regulatory LuxR family protein n=1 Tax=Kitasatospora paracochleata TaxID=58354 RepID=A0ABT1J776_9ACTN|nr:LuxR family transcriptional regulator [Kitasatospora paracochleata]MCP2313069.1 hypothetical protein [Kitasatospora paracochleata]
MSGPAAGPLPGDAERALYLEILAQGGRVGFVEAARQDPGAVVRLIGLGLLVPHGTADQLTAVSPRAVAGRIGAGLRTEATRMLVRAERMPEALAELVEAYEAAVPEAERSAEVEHVDEMEQIRHRILQIEADYREEGLSAQPGRRPPEHLADDSRSRAALERGVEIRVLYQPVSRDDPATAAYVARATGWGMRFRVLDEAFTRMIIFDRRVAVIPAAADNRSAAFVEDPAVVAVLAAGFLRDWERAERIRWEVPDRTTEAPVHDMVGTLLAQGLTQRAIAGRMGLSERTVAGHIARLRDLYDAETLFQLGWLMRGGVDE